MRIQMKIAALVVSAAAGAVGCASDRAPSSRPQAERSIAIDETFTGRVTKRDLGAFDYVPDHWPGRWTLRVKSTEYVLEYTNFSVTEEIEVSEEDMQITGTPAPNGPFNCFDDSGERLTGEGEAKGLYRYTLNEEALELTAVEEPCDLRRVLLERRWTLQP